MANIEIDKLEYLKIQILKSEIINETNSPLQKGDNFKLKFNLKATDLYNIEESLIRVIVNIEIAAIKNGIELIAGSKFEIDNYFRHIDLNLFAKIENDKVKVESHFSELLKGLAYSTSRGIIFSKLSGTFLDETILPIKMSTDV